MQPGEVWSRYHLELAYLITRLDSQLLCKVMAHPGWPKKYHYNNLVMHC